MKKDQSLQIPFPVAEALVSIGAAVRTARARRRQSAKDLADRMDVSLPTLRRLERGDSGVSIGAFATALWALGMLSPLCDAIAPENDREAAELETARLPQRIRRRRETELDNL